MEKRPIKTWITIKHVHIPIFEGETKQDAVNRFKEGVRKGKQTAPIFPEQYNKKRDAAEKAVNALQKHQERVDRANERIKTDTSAEAQKEKLNADRTFKEAMQRYSTRQGAFDAIKNRKQIKSYEFRKKQVDKELSEKQDQISRTSQIAEQMNNTKSTYENEQGFEITKNQIGALTFTEKTWKEMAELRKKGKFIDSDLRREIRDKVDKLTENDEYNDTFGALTKEFDGDVAYLYESVEYENLTDDEYWAGWHVLAEWMGLKKKEEPPKPKEPEYERTPKMDWIDKRIQGKQAELEKLEKKMERIKKAEASGWENNPYYYGERDLRATTKDIESAKKSLQDYKDQMEKEIEKAKSRNVPVITEFLDDWEKRSIEYFIKEKGIYDEALQEYYKRDHEYVDFFNHPYKTIPDFDRSNPEHKELYQKKWNEHSEYRKFFKAQWNYITQFNDGQGTWEENMRNAVRKEKYAKYDDIITRTNDLIGQITDAGALHIGKKGDLNGVIVGTKGKATVETIGAGGYNIQRYHFRTLINPIKEKVVKQLPQIRGIQKLDKTAPRGYSFYNVNGKEVQTNYGKEYPLIRGDDIKGWDMKLLNFRETDKEALERLGKDYDVVKFAETATRVRGYHNTIAYVKRTRKY